MKGRFVWKFVLTGLVLLWAITNLLPITGQPFEDYVVATATDNVDELERLVDEAQSRVEAKEAEGVRTTPFLELRAIATEKRIDLQKQFFPNIRLSSKNIDRKNHSLLMVLEKRSNPALKPGLDLGGGSAFTLRIDDAALATATDADSEGNDEIEVEQRLDKAVEIMGRRVDGLGVAEPVIRPIPPNQLEIQLPGLDIDKNPEAAEQLQKAARLDFAFVWRGFSPGMPERGRAPNDAEVGSLVNLPMDPSDPDSAQPAFRVMVLEREDPRTGEIDRSKYYIKHIPEFSGEVAEATAYMRENGQFAIGVRFTDKGETFFANMTTDMDTFDQRVGATVGNAPKSTQAIILDDQLYSVVQLAQGPLTDGYCEITGDFTQKEATELANALNNPLAFDLVVDDMYTVSPQLAKDAQSASVNAALLGATLVITATILYYFTAGIVAVIAIALNIIIVMGALASINATLTLPGVAALVLTVGMAVDANILIFERIREEMRGGKGLKTALYSGYNKAFSTIIDANVTTLITALILIQLGTGPVKGFGITLAIGIGASVFSALLISRAFLELLVEKGIVKTLIPVRFKGSFDFVPMTFRRPAFLTSWIIVAIGVAAIAFKGKDVLGIDFLGGAEVTFSFNQDAREDINVLMLEKLAEDNQLGEIKSQFYRVVGDAEERLKIQMELPDVGSQGDLEAALDSRVDQLEALMLEAFPAAQPVSEATNVIGPAVSETVTRNAFLSVSIALLGILLYVALRFEVGFGIGAVVATVHDVLMTIGIFVVLGGTFTSPMIAAILMIVGYSINDTIVVFDRIREELELQPDMNLFDIVNLAINRTLSRTFLTSATTLFAATSLFIFGAGVIKDYSLVFIIGILTGTFSSIFIASPVFYWWHKGSRKHVEDRELTRPSYEWEIGGERETGKLEG